MPSRPSSALPEPFRDVTQARAKGYAQTHPASEDKHARIPEVGFGGCAFPNSEDCVAAEARITKLSVAPAGSDKKAERVGPIDAVNAYRLKQDLPHPQP
ncbi:hypothetical protein QO058_14245 [Bosea vestrisii]|uniref:hypothetical protein n=1 Tax=Bosea vestrisii TaxID=151416 RepID=UPI0024DFD802|nr:hypothetical protein [Bosea vestrisii]WID99293.1 hypothetical protein QO058_14245 [Bosea vestrisii]